MRQRAAPPSRARDAHNIVTHEIVPGGAARPTVEMPAGGDKGVSIKQRDEALQREYDDRQKRVRAASEEARELAPKEQLAGGAAMTYAPGASVIDFKHSDGAHNWEMQHHARREALEERDERRTYNKFAAARSRTPKAHLLSHLDG